jgi:DNA polymerase I
MILAIDTESNTHNHGAPFDRRFKTVCYSYSDGTDSGANPWTRESVEELEGRIKQSKVLVGFNLKYDLHVLRTKGILVPDGVQVWDCQIAEFVRSKQTQRYPSLNEILLSHGLEPKFDEVAKYWEAGVQTEEIPWDILSAYATQDALQTLLLYEAQQKVLSEKARKLVRLQGLDLLVLEEMEWNGLKYDEGLLEERATEIRNKISEITDKLRMVYPDVPINFNSGDDLSSFLYGGKVTEEVRIHDGFFKTGARAGQAKFRREEVVHELPRLVTPLRGSELKKEGFYATNADTLLKLKGTRKTKEIIELIQKRTRLDSLLSKTYESIKKVNLTQNWEPAWLHGQFNQVVAQTGRLSSSSPNLQNLDSEANDLFISRYNKCPHMM